MQTYLQKMEEFAYLLPGTIRVIAEKLAFSEEEAKRYVAFRFCRASKEGGLVRQPDLVLLPLGDVSGTELYCLFEPISAMSGPRWSLNFAGTAEEITAQTGSRLKEDLPRCTMAMVEYNLHLLGFAYVRPVVYARLEGQFENGLTAQQNVVNVFRERHQTGLIIMTASSGYENAAFSVGVRPDGTHVYAVFSPNWHADQQPWHCAGFYTRETMNGFVGVDFVAYERAVEEAGVLKLRQPGAVQRREEEKRAEEKLTPAEEPQMVPNTPQQESPRVFLIYGMDTQTQQMPAEVGMLETWLRSINLEPVKVSPEEDHGGEVILNAFENAVAQCCFALSLFTPTDYVQLWAENADGVSDKVHVWYARPNVVYETGYCIAKLGRDHVRILKPAGGKRELKLPSDIEAIDWTRLDPQGQWKSRLMEAFRKAGLIT